MTPAPLIAPVIAHEIAAALAGGRPVVALESTILTHGLPAPEAEELAGQAEAEIRAAGALPATIAVIDGALRVGLSEAERARLIAARAPAKISRADLGLALAGGWTGGTTVAATLIAARLVGIGVFATGGIGGVHRGAETTFDISADLGELARSPVTVVAAGAKAILDLPRTLEALETLGVPVIGFGTDTLPAFWSRDSGLPVPCRLDSAGAVARAHLARGALGLGGQLVANPIPAGAEIPRAEIAPVIEAALAGAGDISAKEVTPHLLSHIAEATGGRAVRANMALMRNNARLGGEIAHALSALGG